MKINATIKPILQSIVLMLLTFAVHAVELTPHTFVVIDLEVRQATLDGMAERVQLLSSGQSVDRQEITMDQVNRKDIASIFRKNGTNAAAHAAYGTRYNAEIREWLDGNPDWQRQYELLANIFESLSIHLDTLSKGY